MGFRFYTDGKKSKIYYTGRLSIGTVLTLGLVASLKESTKYAVEREKQKQLEEEKLKVKFDKTDYKFNLNAMDTELHKIDSDIFNKEFAKHQKREAFKSNAKDVAIIVGLWTLFFIFISWIFIH